MEIEFTFLKEFFKKLVYSAWWLVTVGHSRVEESPDKLPKIVPSVMHWLQKPDSPGSIQPSGRLTGDEAAEAKSEPNSVRRANTFTHETCSAESVFHECFESDLS
jgi:hypothetical protein